MVLIILQVDPHSVHATGHVLPSLTCLHIQEARLALFHVRPLLLCYPPQLRLSLVLPLKRGSVYRLLLLEPRLAGECRHHMEKQSCIPRPRQSYFSFRAYVCSSYIHSNQVRIPAISTAT